MNTTNERKVSASVHTYVRLDKKVFYCHDKRRNTPSTKKLTPFWCAEEPSQFIQALRYMSSLMTRCQVREKRRAARCKDEIVTYAAKLTLSPALHKKILKIFFFPGLYMCPVEVM